MTMVMHARDLRCTLGTSARIQLAAGKTSFGPPAFASLPTFTQITNTLSHHGNGLRLQNNPLRCFSQQTRDVRTY